MEHEMVSLADFARELELTKSATRKAIKTLEAKSRRKFMNKGRVEGNQRGYVLTREAANEVLTLRKQEGFTVGSTASAIVASASMPNVYVLDLNSGRMKIGYTDTFDQRLRSHRTVAPNLTVLRRWALPTDLPSECPQPDIPFGHIDPPIPETVLDQLDNHTE